jgi:hypothetical protein
MRDKMASMKTSPLVTAIALLAASAPAAAQDEVPQLTTLDRHSDRSSLTLDFSYTFWDDIEVLGSTVEIEGFAFTLHGQYLVDVASTSRAGGYVTAPLGHGSTTTRFGDTVIDETDDTGPGNIELGAVGASGAGGGVAVGRIGVALPTASDDGGPTASAFARITDAVLFPADTWTLRISGSYLFRRGVGFARLDAGIDLPFADDEEDGFAFNDEDPLLRGNVAVGAVLEPAAVMVELATLATTGDVDDNDERYIHTLAVGFRWLGGPVEPMAALVIPLDDDINDIIDFSLLLGISAPLDPLY